MTISFDLWGTLIKGNPKFKKAKNELIRSYSDLPDKDLLNDYFIEDQISQLKVRHDSIIEIYGTQPNIKHLFAEVSSVFSIPAGILNIFYAAYQILFMDFPPLIYSENTLPVLEKLKVDGHIIILSSNTLFASPATMIEVIQKIEIPLRNGRFSGTLGVSKPNKDMFFPGTSLHVGDNIRTDGASTRCGIEFFQINSNDKTIIDLYEHVSLLQKGGEIHAPGQNGLF